MAQLLEVAVFCQARAGIAMQSRTSADSA